MMLLTFFKGCCLAADQGSGLTPRATQGTALESGRSTGIGLAAGTGSLALHKPGGRAGSSQMHASEACDAIPPPTQPPLRTPQARQLLLSSLPSTSDTDDFRPCSHLL